MKHGVMMRIAQLCIARKQQRLEQNLCSLVSVSFPTKWTPFLCPRNDLEGGTNDLAGPWAPGIE